MMLAILDIRLKCYDHIQAPPKLEMYLALNFSAKNNNFRML